MRYFLLHSDCLVDVKHQFYQDWDAFLKQIDLERIAKQQSWHISSYYSTVTGLTLHNRNNLKATKGLLASFATNLVQKGHLCLRIDMLPVIERRLDFIKGICAIVFDYAYLV